jgi:hypothetical protein
LGLQLAGLQLAWLQSVLWERLQSGLQLVGLQSMLWDLCLLRPRHGSPHSCNVGFVPQEVWYVNLCCAPPYYLIRGSGCEAFSVGKVEGFGNCIICCLGVRSVTFKGGNINIVGRRSLVVCASSNHQISHLHLMVRDSKRYMET